MSAILQLTLVAFRGLAPASPQVCEFDQDEILIGRAVDNDFVVEDPERYCSRYHARCYRAENQFFVEDTSTPGTQVNAGQFLTRGNRHRLVTGDLLHIGECQIQIEVIETKIASSLDVPNDAFSIEDFFSSGSEDYAETPEVKKVSLPNIPHMSSADFYSAPNSVPDFEPSPIPTPANDHESSASVLESYQSEYHVEPQPQPQPQREVEVISAAVHSENSAPSADPGMTGSAIDSQAIRAFLQGLNIEPGDLVGRNKEEIMFSAGQMLRVLTQGTMEILQSRNDVKKEFGMDVTRIGAEMNNPLKFSQTSGEAMLKLLTHAEGYMSAHDAVKEGVVDAKAHQMAVMSGMQAAIVSMLERFKPEKLEEQLTSRFVLSRKGKYWETYKDAYKQLVAEAEDDFHALFGDEFSQVYLEQVREIEASYSQE